MSSRLSHAALSRLEEGALRLVDHIEDITARRELMRLAQREGAYFGCSGTLDSGTDFGLYFDPYGLRYGELEADGFCQVEVYGPDGDHLYGFGGDGYDLEDVVCGGPRT